MTADIIAFLIIGTLSAGNLAFLFWFVRESKRTQEKLINALISKDPSDFQSLEAGDLLASLPKPVETPPDLIPVSDLTDEEFDEKVLGKEVS